MIAFASVPSAERPFRLPVGRLPARFRRLLDRLPAQVEVAKLEYRASRLVRATNAATGKKGGFGEGGASEVVSARRALAP